MQGAAQLVTKLYIGQLVTDMKTRTDVFVSFTEWRERDFTVSTEKILFFPTFFLKDSAEIFGS